MTTKGAGISIPYASPERLDGSRPDFPSDMWAWVSLFLKVRSSAVNVCVVLTRSAQIITGISPQGQIARIIKQLPPADISSLSMSTPFLEMLEQCWNYDPLGRPTIEQCLTVVQSELTEQSLEVSSVTLEGHTSRVLHIAFSPDGALLASVSDDTTLRMWDSGSGSLITTLKEGHSIVRLAFSPSGRRIALKSPAQLSIWEVAPESSMAPPRGQEWVRTRSKLLTTGSGSLAFSPDGGLLACGTGFGQILVWDGSSGALLSWSQACNYPVLGLAFSRDGRWLASSWSPEVRIWDACAAASHSPMKSSLRPAVTLNIRPGIGGTVAFSPNGLFLSVGSFIGTIIRIYNVPSWSRLTEFNVGSKANSLTFSPNSIRLACGTENGDVEIWDTQDWTRVVTLNGHRGGINSVEFSPDGTRLASCSDDETVRIWRVKPKTISTRT